MTAVDDDMPRPSPTEPVIDPDPFDASRGPRKPGEPMTEAELKAAHKGNLHRAKLAIMVRRTLIQELGLRQCFSELARRMRRDLRCYKARGQDALRHTIADSFSAPEGPARPTIAAILHLVVKDEEREVKAKEWAKLYELAHGERPDFLALIASWQIPKSRPPADETNTPASSRPPSGAARTKPDDGDLAAKDSLIAELRLRLAQADDRTQLIMARLEEVTTSPHHVSQQRYQRIGTYPRSQATVETIDDALQWLTLTLDRQPEVLDPEEDLARTTERWQQNAVTPGQFTIDMPAVVRAATIILLINAALMMLGFVVSQAL